MNQENSVADLGRLSPTPDPGSNNNKRGRKTEFFVLQFLEQNFHKIEQHFIFKQVQKNWTQLTKYNCTLYPKYCH
jgi:hypothetical protein